MTQAPPDALTIGNYYPAGILPGSAEDLKKKFESQVGAEIGSSYSISVVVTRNSLPDGAFDVVDVTSFPPGNAALVDKMLKELAPKTRP
jgi:hypothetical protein